MNYYKLNPNPESKKWKGYEVPSIDLWHNGDELSEYTLYKLCKQLDFAELEYRTLVDGDIPPISHIGSCFIMFSSNIADVESIGLLPGLQLIPVVNKSNLHKYFLLNNYKQIDCVDWEKSEVDKWPTEHKIEEWQNKRGRFFITPVLIKNKIPNDVDVFRLQEWSSAFNIIISEKLKEKIFNLEFDKSFLTLDLLKTV